MAWSSVDRITLEKQDLILHQGAETSRISLGSLLEDPAWILDRARAWLPVPAGGKDRREPLADMADLQAALQDVSCTSCGGRVPVELGAEEVVCGFCGGRNVLPEKVRDALRRLAVVIRQLPEAHRQLHEKSLRNFLADDARVRRRMVWAGAITAAVMLLFAVIDVISDSVSQGTFTIDPRFVPGMTGLALLSLATGLVLSWITRRVALSYTLPMRAFPPPDPGGAARCRLCGAELPAEGVIRRCEYCGTDSVVTGARLEKAEQTARRALQQARAQVERSTEGAARVLDRVASNLAAFANLQFFWLHIPIMVALDGYFGPLRVTVICVAVILASLVAGIVGLRWMNREQKALAE
jgi:hypothetical protein